MITTFIVLVALGILGWGFYRARPFGKLGILAWLQSVVLMAPWLLFFSLFAAGIYLNLIGILVLFVLSTGLYVILGNRLRSLSQDATLSRRASAIADSQSGTPETGSEKTVNSEANAPTSVGRSPDLVIQEPDIIPIPVEDLKAIQGIFGIDTFFATETIPYQEGAIFRGNMRKDPEVAFTQLSESLKNRLGDRYRLFLVEGQDAKPVVIVLPSSRDPKPLTLPQRLLAIALLLATVLTTLQSAGVTLEIDLISTPNQVAKAIPLASGILGVLLAHELGHWLMARRHQVRLSLPFFIPTLPLGSFGAITRFESLLPNRSVLFDVAIAGPAAGGIVSLIMLLVGLSISHAGSLFTLPSEFFQGSILVGTLARVVLRESLQQPTVDIHPLVVLGWLGLVITALNLMPAGQLDGGRIVQAIYGRTVAGRTTIASIIVLGLASLVNPIAIYWAIVVLFIQRDLERPNLNDLTEPNDARAALGLLILFLMVATLLPLTPSLAGRLGIGA
jgi:membrane-associated protease RseP (regulator of RpoE activity)